METAVLATIPNVLVVPFVMLSFMRYSYGPRYARKGYYILAYIGYCGIFALTSYTLNNLLLNASVGFAAFMAVSILLFRPSSKKFILNLFFYMYLSIVDFIAAPLFSFATGKSLEEMMSQFVPRLLACSTSLILLLFTYRLIIRLLARRQLEKISPIQTVFIVALALSQLLSTTLFMQNDYSMGKLLIIVILALYLFIDIYIVYMFEYIAKKNELQRDRELEQQQAEMMRTYYENLQAKFEDSRRTIHDMKNHIAAIKNLSDSGQQYARMLTKDLDALGYAFKSSDAVLMVVMNDKLALARAKGIETVLTIEDVSFSFMREIDTTSLLANLLDNAIEANETLEAPGRKMEVTLRDVGHHIVFCFANPYAGVRKPKGAGFETSKGKQHGYGLANVRRVVDSYAGHMDIDTEKGTFTVNIVIPVPMKQ